ncbi:hypothetical protein HMPREF1581_01486 [Gardnerella vaginalis JCP8108]|uniref:Uncharacterized protein n=1 Tax=Gardnerella vaginalis JCP8108 TaxID=1261066 RepID=S4GJF2_GARVA|nr:hypothetical protein HMPREF1581_01486 [Gardnerella vaginalis JCP8108]
MFICLFVLICDLPNVYALSRVEPHLVAFFNIESVVEQVNVSSNAVSAALSLLS